MCFSSNFLACSRTCKSLLRREITSDIQLFIIATCIYVPFPLWLDLQWIIIREMFHFNYTAIFALQITSAMHMWNISLIMIYRKSSHTGKVHIGENKNKLDYLVLHRAKCKFPPNTFTEIAQQSINPLTLAWIRDTCYYSQLTWNNLKIKTKELETHAATSHPHPAFDGTEHKRRKQT